MIVHPRIREILEIQLREIQTAAAACQTQVKTLEGNLEHARGQLNQYMETILAIEKQLEDHED